MSGSGRTALIVGASRGLGLGLVQRHIERGWRVIATVRSESPALQALRNDRLEIEPLDMTRTDQVDALADRLSGRPLDLLFVNAGIMGDKDTPAGRLDDQGFLDVLRTNTLSPMRIIERIGPLVTPNGTIAVMSSGLGSIANNSSGGYEAYRASKAALNMLMCSAAARDDMSGRSFLAVDPGWVRTDMGGAGAPLDVETSTGGIADMLEARRGTPGAFFVSHADKIVAW